MPSNPFGNPGQVAYIGYVAKKAGSPRAGYHHEFDPKDRPELVIGKDKDLRLRGGAYDYQEHRGDLWLENGAPRGLHSGPPHSSVLPTRGGNLHVKRGFQMSKRGRLAGHVTFVGHKGGSHKGGSLGIGKFKIFGRGNGALITTDWKAWAKRGASVAGGGLLYFGGRKVLDRVDTAGRIPALYREAGLALVGILGGFTVAKFLRDRWAGIGFAAIPVFFGAKRAYEAWTAGSSSTTPPGTGTKGVGAPVYDDYGRFIGRFVDRVYDNTGRTIGAVLALPGGGSAFLQGKRVVSTSRVPLAYDTNVSRVPLAYDTNVSGIAGAPAGSMVRVPVSSPPPVGAGARIAVA